MRMPDALVEREKRHGRGQKSSFSLNVDAAMQKTDSDVNFGDCLQFQAGRYYAEYQYCDWLKATEEQRSARARQMRRFAAAIVLIGRKIIPNALKSFDSQERKPYCAACVRVRSLCERESPRCAQGINCGNFATVSG
jgi:hypothetical protein